SLPGSSFLKDKKEKVEANFDLSDEDKEKLTEINGINKDSGKAVMLNKKLEEVGVVSAKAVSRGLNKADNVSVIVIDGSATKNIIASAEEKGVKVIVASNFGSTDTNIKLMSF
ncbi:MAG: hypothetical protein OQK82_09275, partial [Candidatus Pacearchaeota archaeon]|nr:hypothetical protein [Candidatus Pacearchaeota archaeon]